MPQALIIDDDPIAQTILQDGLKACGYSKFMTASDGLEATEIYRSSADKIDLVITDILMPKFDGIEFVSFMANFKNNCPVIVSSGANKSLIDSTMKLGKTLGVNIIGQIDKPFTMEKLKDILGHAEGSQEA